MHFVSQITLPPSEASRVTVTRAFQQPARSGEQDYLRDLLGPSNTNANPLRPLGAIFHAPKKRPTVRRTWPVGQGHRVGQARSLPADNLIIIHRSVKKKIEAPARALFL
jgi:hypothetical protein